MSSTSLSVAPSPEWMISDEYVPYPAAVTAMERRVAAIRAGTDSQAVWLLEHPPIYTAGTSAKASDLIDHRFPVFETGRGGQYTYHGPGQRVAYVMLDLKHRGSDLRAYVRDLESWIIDILACFGIIGERREGRVGIWVNMAPYGGRPGQENKIAAIGVRVRKWVTYHGIALNVDPDLSHYGGIVPCGIQEHGVTSMTALGLTPGMAEVDMVMRDCFKQVFEA